MTAALNVTSHVARDLLQSAAVFKQVPPVVWEYVSNGLDYVDPGVAPLVSVTLSPKRITITDNGRGMLRGDLERFFTMHGENLDRRQGRPGRGHFGTGKSAAFAIADTLRLTTIRNGRRSVVELHRTDLDRATHGGAVPVRLLEDEKATTEPNGTKVEIEALKRVRLDSEDVRRHLERHLRYWRGVGVELNGVPLEPLIPPIERTTTVLAGPTDPELVRGLTLTLHVSKTPLSEDERGVAVLAENVLHEVTLAGAERKDFSQYIFGEIDVPALSRPHEGVDAFDMTRSGRLNPENRVVIDTFAFVGRHVEKLRLELVEADRERRRQAEVARLQAQANEIARLINDDYADFARRFQAVRATARGEADTAPAPTPARAGAAGFVAGGEEPAVPDLGREAATEGTGGGAPTDGATEPAVQPAQDRPPETTGHETPVEEKPRRRSGGFEVTYEHAGTDSHRCHYDRDRRRLIINLDHPQLTAALGGGAPDQPEFRRLSYEVAVTEYAVSLARENAVAGYYHDLDEPLVEVRDRLDSLSRRIAHLFAPA